MVEKAKVCYVIFSQTDKSVGGHYRSLFFHYSSFLGNAVHKDSSVLNFGKIASPVLNNLPGFKFISTKNPFFILAAISVVRKMKPDVLHCYDMASLVFAKIVSLFFPVKIIYTKCGGKNLRKYNDVTTIFFSSENHQDYLKKGGQAPAFLLPNRAVKTQYDPADILSLEKNLGIDRNEINFLRINRLSTTYVKSMQQCVNLIRKLNEHQIKVKLYIVGTIEKQEVYELFSNMDENVIVITDKEFTTTASNLIPAFDYVIATGRGVMEAFSYDKNVLIPCSNTEIPLLVGEHNFDTMLYYNFSPRTVLDNLDQNEEFAKIVNLLSSKEENNRYASQIFKKYFDVSTVIENYGQIYFDVANGNTKGSSSLSMGNIYYLISKIVKTW